MENCISLPRGETEGSMKRLALHFPIYTKSKRKERLWMQIQSPRYHQRSTIPPLMKVVLPFLRMERSWCLGKGTQEKEKVTMMLIYTSPDSEMAHGVKLPRLILIQLLKKE